MKRCTEIKLTLSGGKHEFGCELLRLDEKCGMLKYVIPTAYRIGPVALAPGDATHALFWPDRPYTLYIWHLGNGVFYYFNVADRISLTPERFLWRDLAIDILIDEAGACLVLDEHELPESLSPELYGYIEAAKAMILAENRALRSEADAILRPYFASEPPACLNIR